jgi:Pumilio-family RNA binding repeat
MGNSPGGPIYPIPEQHDWRRLLDRSMSCNWNAVLEKIIFHNDQQASLFLQQKLKLATPIQKHEIIDTIVHHSHPLMVNRFGNFLIQRCFEYGTKDQIDGIANSILGSVVNLSMDMFGCHVIQKAFDCVDEEYKVCMVKELLCRIPETVNHRFACHVWQKLLEIRWRGPPPIIMKYVNDALRGHWTEIAVGETGSLVVQNIFENCLDEDKVFP